jgi:hypothetical protein
VKCVVDGCFFVVGFVFDPIGGPGRGGGDRMGSMKGWLLAAMVGHPPSRPEKTMRGLAERTVRFDQGHFSIENGYREIQV